MIPDWKLERYLTGDLPAAAAVLKDQKDGGDRLLDILEQEIRTLLHAKVTGGQYFDKEHIADVAKAIQKNDNIKPIASYQKKYAMMLNSPWYLAAIVLLLGIEWFLRKWNGGY